MSESCWCVPLLRLLPPWATSARFRISDNPSLEASEIDSGDAWSNEPTASDEGENGQSGTLKEGGGGSTLTRPIGVGRPCGSIHPQLQDHFLHLDDDRLLCVVFALQSLKSLGS